MFTINYFCFGFHSRSTGCFSKNVTENTTSQNKYKIILKKNTKFATEYEYETKNIFISKEYAGVIKGKKPEEEKIYWFNIFGILQITVHFTG